MIKATICLGSKHACTEACTLTWLLCQKQLNKRALHGEKNILRATSYACRGVATIEVEEVAASALLSSSKVFEKLAQSTKAATSAN